MKKIAIPLLAASLLLGACSSSENSSTSNEPIDSDSSATSGNTHITGPVGEDEFGGGEVDTGDGQESQDIAPLAETIEALMSVRKYTYETTYSISGVAEKVVDHYGEHYFYEENVTHPDDSFGYAEEAYGQEKNVFRFYVDEGEGLDRYRASIYEYSAFSTSDPVPLQEVFGATGVAGLHNIYEGALEELTAIRLTEVSYLLTSSSLYTVFQYMTQFGSSIAELMTEIRLDILDRGTNSIRVSIALGDYGDIVSVLTPLETAEFDDLDAALEEGAIRGIDYHQGVVDLFEGALSKNNYSFRFDVDGEGGTFDAYLSNDYFLVDYDEAYNQQGYSDFGYAFLPGGAEVQLETIDENGDYAYSATASVPYSACYEFDYVGGQVHFLGMVGPNETDGMKIFEVATRADLESIAEEDRVEGYLYVVSDENYVYTYGVVDATTGEYGFAPYDEWFDTVGDFYLSGSATFYTSSAAIGELARYYMEEDPAGGYFTKDSSFVYQTAHSLFGFGAIGGTTWIDYCESAYANYIEEDGEILTAEIGLRMLSPDMSRTMDLHMDIYDIGKTSVPNIESALDEAKGGQQ